jgi:hypothetical protein
VQKYESGLGSSQIIIQMKKLGLLSETTRRPAGQQGHTLITRALGQGILHAGSIIDCFFRFFVCVSLCRCVRVRVRFRQLLAIALPAHLHA